MGNHPREKFSQEKLPWRVSSPLESSMALEEEDLLITLDTKILNHHVSTCHTICVLICR